jgi:hypothetical protein
VPIAGLDTVEVGVEVRAREVPRWSVEPVEQVGAEQRLVDRHPLRRREGSPLRFVGQEANLHPGAALGRLGRLVPRTDEDRDPVEHEGASHAAAQSTISLVCITGAMFV